MHYPDIIFQRLPMNAEVQEELLPLMTAILETVKRYDEADEGEKENIDYEYGSFDEFGREAMALISVDSDRGYQALIRNCVINNYDGIALMGRLMIIEVARASLFMVNPYLIESVVRSFFHDSILPHRMFEPKNNPDVLNDFLEAQSEPMSDAWYDKKISDLWDQAAAMPETSLLEKPILALTTMSVQTVLTECDSATLIAAGIGASGAVVIRILSNMSREAGGFLLRDMENARTVPREEVIAAQQKILGIISRLEKSGDIHWINRNRVE